MFSYLWLAGALRPAQVGDISILRICVTLYFGFYKAVKGTFATDAADGKCGFVRRVGRWLNILTLL